MTEDPHQYIADDEIDLFALFQTVWDGKWIIFLFTLCSITFGGAYAFLFPTTYNGKLIFSEVSEEDISKFSTLNIAYNKIVESEKVVSGKELLIDFIREFNDYEELKHFVVKFSKEYNSFEGTEDEKRVLSIELAKIYEIMPPSKDETNYHIKFETNDTKESFNIIENALLDIITNVHQSNLRRLENLKSGAISDIQNQIQTIEQKLNAIRNSIDLENNWQLAILKEQAALARELGIEHNSLDTASSSRVSAVTVNVDTDIPYYLRGYRAIEKEISLINGRKGDEKYLFSYEYVNLSNQLLKLKADVRVQIVDEAIKNSPFNKSFIPIDYHLDLIEFKSQKKTNLILALSIVLGLMVGGMFILMRKGFQNYKNKN